MRVKSLKSIVQIMFGKIIMEVGNLIKNNKLTV